MNWISTEDQDPTIEDGVIVCTADGHVEAGMLMKNGEWHWINTDQKIKIPVLFWMPFPEAPNF
jgi:hypothetical protein